MWLPCMARRVRFIAVHPVNVRHVPSSSIVIRISSYLSIATSAVIGIIGDVVIGCCLLQFTAVRCTCSLCQTHCSPRGLSWRAHHALQALGLLVVSAARDIFLYPPPIRASQRVASRPCVSRIKICQRVATRHRLFMPPTHVLGLLRTRSLKVGCTPQRFVCIRPQWQIGVRSFVS
jgi:hypothetical protein